DEATKRYSKGGRLIYIGAGTSGRLGVLDAAELVPTYGIKPERAIGLIAGGKGAMYVAVEGAEDSQDLAKKDLKDLKLN
ncbi:N-acetylmuramic acid 6-phosphate etherase, partial [Escherichia coli]|nr:N-acetylmuramic acid 6-phosphate etherase [Escherichia coli]